MNNNCAHGFHRESVRLSKLFVFLPVCLFAGIILGYASHYHRHRGGANSLYTNETVEWGYDGMYSAELYTQRAINIIKNHDTKKVCHKVRFWALQLCSTKRYATTFS